MMFLIKRPRLKGCEGEIAGYLDPRWKALTFEWSVGNDRRSSGRVAARRAIPAAVDDRRV